MYREARDGACVMYREMRADEGHSVDGGRHGMQSSSAQGSTEGDERMREAQCTNCEANSCNVLIGENTYCSKCSTTSEAPVNGVCTATTNTACEGSVTTGLCTQCKSGYFLHKGGCYAQATTPGSTICKTAGSTAGLCEACQTGYFKNPANSNQKDSCIACGDATGDTTNNNKGVQNCATCTVEGAGTTGKTAKCTTCVDGYFANSEGTTCTECNSDANCATCSGAATQCTSCKGTGTKLYFKKGSGETGECVEKASCKGNYFPNDDVDGKKQCIPCGDSAHGGIDGCTTCAFSQVSGKSTLTCSVCTPDTKKPNKEGTGCFACSVDGCSNCNKDGVCEACGNSKKVSPGGSSCLTDCPENSTANESACICNSGFAASGDKCTSSSTNKSALSTGAIAGISVAAVVVVGGLVGFLCWWFVCRGKA